MTTTSNVGAARGILRPHLAGGPYTHARHAPPDDLRALVAHYWSVGWDLRGQPAQQQETLPHPNVHLVIEAQRSGIYGVPAERFVRVLEGCGLAFGVKFRPGGFFPFFGKPLSVLADRCVSVASVFGADGDRLEIDVLACADDAGRIDLASTFLRQHWPPPDPQVDRVSAIVASIVDDRRIGSVDALSAACGMGKRALQRLFQLYVGTSPKWVINRYRLHDAIERLVDGQTIDWAAFALELGYFDQAHFIRDFRKVIGRTPAEYGRARGQ